MIKIEVKLVSVNTLIGLASHQNIRISTVCSKNDALQHKIKKSTRKSLNSTPGNEFPNIKNSVVDESLPFQNLNNHTHHISSEGFSGARATYYNK
jgi:hypothetical protein